MQRLSHFNYASLHKDRSPRKLHCHMIKRAAVVPSADLLSVTSHTHLTPSHLHLIKPLNLSCCCFVLLGRSAEQLDVQAQAVKKGLSANALATWRLSFSCHSFSDRFRMAFVGITSSWLMPSRYLGLVPASGTSADHAVLCAHI